MCAGRASKPFVSAMQWVAQAALCDAQGLLRRLEEQGNVPAWCDHACRRRYVPLRAARLHVLATCHVLGTRVRAETTRTRRLQCSARPSRGETNSNRTQNEPKYYSTKQTQRFDLNPFFKKLNLSDGGFWCRINPYKLEKGEYKLFILVKAEGETQQIETDKKINILE